MIRPAVADRETMSPPMIASHRFFHVVPGDETWYLLGIGLISIAWFGPGFRGVGFRRPASWRRTTAGGVAIGVALQPSSTFVAAALGLLFSSALFAAGHSSQGLPDALDAGVHGLVFGATYLATGRNIWMPLIAHGATDTIGAGMVYLGLF